MRSVAIVGAYGAGQPAPYADDGWEIWTVGRMAGRVPRINRLYELHAPEVYQAWTGAMEATGARVVLASDLPLAVWRDAWGGLVNTVAVMLCHAFHEGVERVALHNAPHRGEPTNDQREGVAYWFGLLRAGGAEVLDRSDCFDWMGQAYGGST